MRGARCPALHKHAGLAFRRCRLANFSRKPGNSWTRQTQHRCLATAAPATQKQSLIRGIQSDLASKKQSATEVTQGYIQRLQEAEPQVQSFLALDCDAALRQAAKVDELIASGAALPPLAGIPLAIKDTICTAGMRTTAGSAVLASYVPSFDATSVARLRAAGATILGKANCDQFAMGSSTESSSFQVTRNPWDLERVPGGSSGGSASSVAAGQVVASLGSDTGGSIRQPAHFCGVVGIKPTYGRVSRYGLIAYGSSLDCIGPLATTVQDAAIVLSCISGRDEADSTSAAEGVPAFGEGLLPAEQLASQPLRGRRIGVIRQTMGDGVDAGVQAAVHAALEHMGRLGAEVAEVSLPTFDMGLPAYYVLALSEASSNLSRYDGIRYGLREQGADLASTYAGTRAQLGAEVKRRILMGTYALSAGYYDAYYQRAQQVRTLVRRELVGALGEWDALVSPVAPTTAWRLGELLDDPLAMFKADVMTVNLNLAGQGPPSSPKSYPLHAAQALRQGACRAAGRFAAVWAGAQGGQAAAGGHADHRQGLRRGRHPRHRARL